MINVHELTKKIMERGYWEVSFLPAVRESDRLDSNGIKKLLEKHQIRYRGWYYPHISRGSGYDKMDCESTFVEGSVHWGAYLEAFRFYTNCKFTHYMGMIEDRIDDEPRGFSRWDLSMQGDPPRQPFLDPTLMVYKLTEILLFASKLGSEGVFGDEVEISIKLGNMGGRILKFLNHKKRIGQYKCHAKMINLSIRYPVQILEREHDWQAIDWSLTVLKQFGMKSRIADLKEDQKKFYQKPSTI